MYLKISDSLGRKEGSETFENGLGFIRHTFYVSENEMRVEIFLLDTFFFFLCLFVCLETPPRIFESITNFFNNYV